MDSGRFPSLSKRSAPSTRPQPLRSTYDLQPGASHRPADYGEHNSPTSACYFCAYCVVIVVHTRTTIIVYKYLGLANPQQDTSCFPSLTLAFQPVVPSVLLSLVLLPTGSFHMSFIRSPRSRYVLEFQPPRNHRRRRNDNVHGRDPVIHPWNISLHPARAGQYRIFQGSHKAFVKARNVSNLHATINPNFPRGGAII